MIGEVIGDTDNDFEQYWSLRSAKARASQLPRPVLRSFPTTNLDDTESLLFKVAAGASRLLDVGAGDNRIKQKFIQHGYTGRYETLDVSQEYEHDYYALDDVKGPYDVIFLLEVIEHLPLGEFHRLMERLGKLLTPHGTLVVSTPNPACICPMWATDMTHIQQYPMNDLLAFFLMRGFQCEGYRVVYTQSKLSLLERLRFVLKKMIVTQIIGCDYADGLIVVATRQSGDR